MKFVVRCFFATVLIGAFAFAQASISQVKVQFAKGASSKTIKGQNKGEQTIDYVVRAAAGQSMKVTMQTSNEASYFNVIPPGETDVASFVGSTSGNTYEGTLTSAGDYKIRVYLMRISARRNERADYTLNISVAGKPHSSH